MHVPDQLLSSRWDVARRNMPAMASSSGSGSMGPNAPTSVSTSAGAPSPPLPSLRVIALRHDQDPSPAPQYKRQVTEQADAKLRLVPPMPTWQQRGAAMKYEDVSYTSTSNTSARDWMPPRPRPMTTTAPAPSVSAGMRFSQQDEEEDYKYDDNEADDYGSMSASGRARRARRMSNSERGKLYRSRRKEYVESLEQKIDSLKRELEQMRLRGRVMPVNDQNRDQMLVPQRDRSHSTFARIVCDYFAVFEYGVPLDKIVSEHSIVDSSQMAFLQKVASPHMIFGEHHDIDMLCLQWYRYSQYHKSLHMELTDLHVQPRGHNVVVCANATLSVRLTRLTIEKVFPHLLWNETLVQQLIGLDVEYPVANTFYFGSNGKIVRYDVEVDFVGAFVRALGSMPTALQIVGKAMIKDQHMICDIDDEREPLQTPVDPEHRGYASPTMAASEWRDPATVPTVLRSSRPPQYYEDGRSSSERGYIGAVDGSEDGSARDYDEYPAMSLRRR